MGRTHTLATIGPVHSASRFSWSKGVGVAEASDLRGTPLFGRLYDDACDLGFRLLNPRTHKVEAFYLSHEDKDASGEDTYGIHFYPVDITLRNQGVRVLIIND